MSAMHRGNVLHGSVELYTDGADEQWILTGSAQQRSGVGGAGEGAFGDPNDGAAVSQGMTKMRAQAWAGAVEPDETVDDDEGWRGGQRSHQLDEVRHLAPVELAGFVSVRC